MATVGKLMMMLEANSTKFEQSLNKAQSKVSTFAEAAKAKFDSIGANAGESPFSGYLSSIPGIISGLNPLVAAGMAAAGAFAAIGEHAGKAAIEARNAAARFGITEAALEGIEKVGKGAGTGQEELRMGLMRLQKELGAAATGSEEAQRKFTRLGLDWKHLTSIPLSDAFADIATHVKDMGSHTEKTNVAFSLFGRGGLSMVNVLDRGGDAIQHKIAQVQALEKVMTKDQVDTIKKSNGAWSTAMSGWGAEWTKASNVIARGWATVKRETSLIIAPAAQRAEIRDMLKKKPVDASAKTVAMEESAAKTEELQHAVAALEKDLAKEAGTIGVSANQYKILEMKTQGATDAMLAHAKALAAAAEERKRTQEGLDLLDKLKQESEAIGVEGAALTVLQAKWKGLSDIQIEHVRDAAELNEKMRKSLDITKEIKSLEMQIRTVGKTAAEAKKLELLFNGETFKSVKNNRIVDLLGQLDDVKKAQQIFDEGKSPLDKFGDKIADLQDLLKKGRIDVITFAKASAKAFDEIDKAGAKMEARNPEAFQFGTAAEYTAILKSQRADEPRGNVQERMQKVLEEQREIARRQLEEQKEQGRLLQKLNVNKVVKLGK